MDSGAENELESENSLSSSPRPQRKNITLKLKSDKGGPSGRGRSRKSNKTQKKSEDPGQQAAGKGAAPGIKEEDVVEAPIFKTMEPGVPLHHNNKLRWDHKVNLIGEKVVDPLIHCCEKCSLPILIYGRMIQCKHVFCFTCAKKTEKTCPRCGDPVQRIEQSALGTVFLCTYGGSKHGNNGCRRTYLSQRDLNAHIGHRHLKNEVLEQSSKPSTSQRAAVSSQQSKGAVTPAQIQASQQALMEQFSAAVRQASAATASSLPARTRPEDMYQHHAQMTHMQQQQQHQLMSTSHPGQQQMMASPQPMPSFAPVHTQLPQGMVQMSAPPSMMSQSSVVSSTNQDNYASSIPVVGNRIKTLISVPLQDDTDYNKQQPQSYQAMPQVNYPPPSMGQYNPVVSMAPNFQQPPPGVPPPMFSTQTLPGQLQGPVYTAPLSQSMSAIQRGPPPQISQGPPRGPPPQISPGAPRGPPAMNAPQGGPPRFFEPAQGQRGPWTGPPPRAPPPGRPPRPRGPQPADYNYY